MRHTQPQNAVPRHTQPQPLDWGTGGPKTDYESKSRSGKNGQGPEKNGR